MKHHMSKATFCNLAVTDSVQETIHMTHEFPFSNPVIQVRPGKLASDNSGSSESDAVREAQERIRRMLEQGKPIPVAPSGDVTGTTGEQPAVQVQPGRLAAIQHWYEKEPDRLDAEKKQMRKIFPQFSLQKLSDGRLAWVGKLRPGLMGRNGWDWHLMAVYNNDHPQAVMGGSVRIYLVRPSIELLMEQLHWRPHLLIDEKHNLYLCTTRAEDVQAGRGDYETTAIQALTWANKWLMGMELVLSGKMSKATFDRPGGI